jgi:hypothetical protein
MRNCEYVGIPTLFQGRVDGVGSQTPGGRSPYDNILDNITSTYTGGKIGDFRVQVCHPKSPAGTCKPVDWKPDAVSNPVPAPSPAPAKPAGSGFPLLLGAALVLLS